MKTLDTDMRTHLDGVVTSLATIWRVTRTDGTIHYFCDHDADITFGGNTYLAREGFQRSAIDSNSDLSVDNLDLMALFGSEITKTEVRAGALDYASIEVSAINWANPDVCGEIKLRKGFFGEARADAKGSYKVELRGMTQLLSQSLLELYQPECRADLGDSRCGIPIQPPVLGRIAVVAVGQFYRVATTAGTGQEQYENRIYEVTTAGTTAGSQPTYDETIGNTTTDGTAVLTARDAWTRDAVVTGVTDRRIFAIDVVEARAVDDWFTGGAVFFETGNNVGKALEIKDWIEGSSTVTLFLPTAYDIQVGDTLRLYAGCDKRRDTCFNKFANVVNFRGEPDLPGPDSMGDYPTTDSQPAGFSWGGFLLGLAGLALGAYYGGGIGGQFGYLLGTVIGNLVAPGSGGKGPRIHDLTVTGSSYGAPIARGYGVIRKNGNIIWSSGLHETKKTHGGGFGTPETIEYKYDATFAISFGTGLATGVTRIWADSKLIYDITHTTGALPDDFIKINGLKFRFYPGSETQLPDEDITAAVGTGLVPAFRGQCYILFDKLPLKQFGNKVPNITAEIVYTGTEVVPANAFKLGTPMPSGALVEASTETFAIDWDRGYAYCVDDVGGGGANTGIRRFPLSSLEEDRQSTAEHAVAQTYADDLGVPHGSTGILGTGPMCVMYSGAILVNGARHFLLFNSQPYLVIDPDTLREVARCGVWDTTNSWPTASTGSTPIMHYGTTVNVPGQLGIQDWALVAYQTGTTPSMALLYHAPPSPFLTGGGLCVAWSSTLDLSTEALPHLNGLCTGRMNDRFGFAHAVMGRNYTTAGTDNVQFWTWRVPPAPPMSDIFALVFSSLPGAGAGVLGAIASSVTGGVQNLRFSRTPAQVLPGETSLRSVSQVCYDSSDDTLIFWAQKDSNGRWYVIKIEATGDHDIVWRTDLGTAPSAPSGPMNQTRITNDRLAWHTTTSMFLIDTVTGEVLINNSTAYRPTGYTTVGTKGAYNSEAGFWIGLSGDTDSVVWKTYPELRDHNPAYLDDIVADICGVVDLGAVDIDVTDLATDTVPGYVISRQMSARDGIVPLMAGYFFDGYESDFKIKFKKRGGAVARTIPEAELVRKNPEDEAAVETRKQEVEMPMKLGVTYMDKDNDYQTSTQYSKRILAPSSSSSSLDEATVELAIACGADQAKQTSEKALYSAWVERTTYQGGTGPKHLDLDPSDVVTLTLEDGTISRARLLQTGVGEGFETELGAVMEVSGQFTSTAVGDPGSPNPNTVPNQYTKTILLDIPLLVDEDAIHDYDLVPMYYAMASLDGRAWNSGTLWRHYDTDSFYSSVGRSTDEATWGYVATPLGDPDTPFATDYVNIFTVRLVNNADVIASCTHTEMLEGANMAALIKLDGTVEVIGFQNATLNGDGSYTFDTLLRGRRGTDTMCYDHEPGETFVLLNLEDDIYAFSTRLDKLNTQQYYKGVQTGADVDVASAISLIPVGRSLMPYAPINPHCTDSAGDIVIDWTKRERLGADPNTDNLSGARVETVTSVVLDGANPDEYHVADTNGFFVGDIVYGFDFTNSANNGYHTVVAVNTGKVEVANGELVAEASPPATARIMKVTTVEEAIEFEIDIYDGPGVAATATLTFTGQPSNGQTFSIASRQYTTQTTLTDAEGNIKIGATTADTVTNIINAINLGTGAGITYAASMTKHPRVSAGLGTGTAVVFTARKTGTEGNIFEKLETLSNASFDAGTYMSGGVNKLLKRAVTGLTEPEFTYTAAMQATDSFSGADLTLAIYMISATIGRGFGRVVTEGVV